MGIVLLVDVFPFKYNISSPVLMTEIQAVQTCTSLCDVGNAASGLAYMARAALIAKVIKMRPDLTLIWRMSNAAWVPTCLRIFRGRSGLLIP